LTVPGLVNVKGQGSLCLVPGLVNAKGRLPLAAPALVNGRGRAGAPIGRVQLSEYKGSGSYWPWLA
jgi:hypothetical protein